jgi:hypothetical protein
VAILQQNVISVTAQKNIAAENVVAISAAFCH